jgi:hypothetical protein
VAGNTSIVVSVLACGCRTVGRTGATVVSTAGVTVCSSGIETAVVAASGTVGRAVSSCFFLSSFLAARLE